MDEWLNWKYDLCENEIQCEGRTIALADSSIFDIKDKEQFNAKVREMGMKLGWLVLRANSTPSLQSAMADLLMAYERLIRSQCTPEQLALKPWECSEFVVARDALDRSRKAQS